MARGDPIFARVDISSMFNPRIRRLTAAQKWFYHITYLCAVEARSERLPPQYDLAAIQDRAGVDTRTSKKSLEKCCSIGLLQIDPQGLICVSGVRKNHERLEWNEYDETAPYGADTGLKREEKKIEKKEKSREEVRGPLNESSSFRQDGSKPSLIGETLNIILPETKQGQREEEPAPERIRELQIRVAGWGKGDLLRYAATGLKNGKLTNSLNEMLTTLPEEQLRGITIDVMAKQEVNGWNPAKAAKVLTARLKTAVRGGE